jgi:colanic acid biosynthesis glycosyl transferase WcaI
VQMRIIIYGINYSPELTGVGKYSGEMAEWLASRGHEVRVVTAPPYYPQWRIRDEFSNTWSKEEKNYTEPVFNNGSGVLVYRCPLWVPARPSGYKRLLHLVSFALSSLPVMLSQVLWRPDVVVVVEPSLLCSPGALFLARLVRGRAWLHVQDFELDAALDLGLIRVGLLRKGLLLIEQWLMKRFDRVSTISVRMLDKLGTKGVAKSQSVLFLNWVDCSKVYPLTHVSPLRDTLGIASDEIVLLYSGNMGQKQGLEMIIAAARLLQADTRLRFVMCGEGSSYEKLRVLANGLVNIIWIPLQPVEQLNALLNLADIHLLPQHSAAADLVMPSKLTGILASGRPVIATATEGTEVWTLVEGKGLNTAPGDVDALVSAIRKLSEHPELRRQLGASARCYAEECLDRNQVLEQFEAKLMDLV